MPRDGPPDPPNPTGSSMSTKDANRFGESGLIPLRSRRIYRLDGEWFFAIRRGVDQGPYSSEKAARDALVQFIRDQLEFERRISRDNFQEDLSITYP